MTDINTLDLKSKNVIVYNLSENMVMYEKNASEVVSIASLTKIMTTITALEEINNLDEEVIITSQMLAGLQEANASVAGFVVGDIVTYRDLLYGTLLPSGADATRALAYSLFGSEENFVRMMNSKAKALGLSNTHFVNTSGLDVNGHYSTVKEVATILKYALNNPLFKQIYMAKSYTTSRGKHIFKSTFQNYLTRYGISMSYVDGAKTGFTDDAGYCLSTIGSGGMADYLVVSTGVDKDAPFPYHVTDAKQLYEYYFSNYRYFDLVVDGESLVTLKAKYSKNKNVEIYSDVTISKYLTMDINETSLTYEYDGEYEVSPFTSTDKKLGEYKVSYKEEVLASIDVFLKEKVPFSLWEFMIQNILFIIITVFAIVIIGLVKHKQNMKRTRKKQKRLVAQ